MAKKTNAAQTAALMTQAEVSNTINLNLSSTDVIDCILEEGKEALEAQNAILIEKFNALSWKSIHDSEMYKLYASWCKNNPVVKAAKKIYPHFKLKGFRNISVVNAVTILNPDITAAEDDSYKQAEALRGGPYLQFYSDVQNYYVHLDLDANEEGETEGIILVLCMTPAMQEEFKTKLAFINQEKQQLWDQLVELRRQYKKLNNNKKARAKFVKSVLEKTPEGKSVLATVTTAKLLDM